MGNDVRRYGRPTYLFCVRARDERCHDRLVIAAREDGLTVGDELNLLLDLRAQWAQLTGAAHPLARPAYVPPVAEPAPPTPEPELARADRPPKRKRWDRKKDGIDYWYGRGYWTPPQKQDQAAS